MWPPADHAGGQGRALAALRPWALVLPTSLWAEMVKNGYPKDNPKRKLKG